MTDIQKAIDDLIDAADRLVNRKDMASADMSLVLTQSITRLERALEQAQKAMEEDKPVIYLASPYSHPDPAVREMRYRQACEMAAGLTVWGHLVYSPVVHSHPLVKWGLPGEWGYWQKLDMVMLSRCQGLMVLTLDGWEYSEGVQAEIKAAKAMGIPVRYTGPGRQGEGQS